MRAPFKYGISVAALVLASSAFAQQNRNQLNYYNNNNITTNGKQQITGAIENNLFGQIINGTALLNDANVYSGSNTFNGPVTFNGMTNLSAVPYLAAGVSATVATNSAVRSGQKPDAKSDYGAICDGTSHPLSVRYGSFTTAPAAYPYATDPAEETDSAALAGLVATWRTSMTALPVVGATYSAEGLGICVTNRTLNVSNMRSYLSTFKFGGTQLWCNVAGGICVDGSMNQFASWYDLSINGRPGANAPSLGLFLGRDSTIDRCNNNSYYNLTVVNTFTFAAVDNFACEVNTFVKATVSNIAPNAYGWVQDGINHWNIASPTLGNTAPQNVANSLYSDIFIGGSSTVTGTGSVPVWLAATSSNRFEDFYTTATGAASATKANVYLYSYTTANLPYAVGDESQGLVWDSHTEGGRTGNAAFFLFTGPNYTQNVMNLTYMDSGYGALLNHFAADVGITSVNLPGFRYDVGNLHNGENVFDQPLVYTVQGFMNLGLATIVEQGVGHWKRHLDYASVYHAVYDARSVQYDFPSEFLRSDFPGAIWLFAFTGFVYDLALHRRDSCNTRDRHQFYEYFELPILRNLRDAMIRDLMKNPLATVAVAALLSVGPAVAQIVPGGGGTGGAANTNGNSGTDGLGSGPMTIGGTGGGGGGSGASGSAGNGGNGGTCGGGGGGGGGDMVNGGVAGNGGQGGYGCVEIEEFF